MDIKSVVAEAMAQTEQEFAAVTKTAPAVRSIQDYATKMATDSPGEPILVTEEFGENVIIPGFTTLSMGLAQIYGLKWGVLGTFQEWREKAYQPHIVPTVVGTHVVRGFSRREWSSLQKKILEHTRDRHTKHVEESSDQRWMETEIQMHTEEMIVVAGCCDPKYDMESIRQVPTGTVSHLANCIMVASGHDANPLPPLPLK